MTDLCQRDIDHFCQLITPWEKAYAHSGFSYFAVLHDGVFKLLHGRLFLFTAPSAFSQTPFQTERVRAGFFPLSQIGIGYRELISQLQAGSVRTPHGDLIFPKDESGRLSSHVVPLHQEGTNVGSRVTFLALAGAQRHSFIKQPELDWELKAGTTPFDSLNELLIEFGLGAYRGDFAHVDAVATPVAEINPQSRVDGEIALPVVHLAKLLDRNSCQIGYRIHLNGRVIDRGSIPGAQFEWSEQNRYWRGEATIGIPRAAVLHCVASYAGCAQHQYWIADPGAFQNPRRAILEEVDEKLEVLRDFLFEENRQRKEARDFEFGVAWLLWLQGFSIAHLGGTQRTADATDLIAMTPRGNVLIVECTTGLLKAENKLAKLVERTELARKQLIASGHSHLKILSVIVTSKDREEVKADLEQAKSLGVVVVTRENLVDALLRTLVAPDPDALFEQATQSQ